VAGKMTKEIELEEVPRVIKMIQKIRGLTAVSIALSTLIIAGTAITATAEDVSQSTPVANAVTGISQPGSFPIKITKSGSYRLNSNLTVKSGINADAIDVKVSSVTIDLSGFTITGGVVAINGLTSGAANVTVINGSITGSGAGVLLSDGAVVRNVRVSNLTGTGSGFFNAITCGNYCTVTGNTVYNVPVGNPGGGPAEIATRASSLVLNNTVTGIGSSGNETGIVVSGNSVVSGNTISNNPTTGILIFGAGTIVSHNTVNNSGTYGLDFVSNPGAYEDNVLLNNVTDANGGTSLGGGNTNLCDSGLC
jgi:parallel beta-helix repeat protein